ncbi:E1-E2 ATPase domain-containing protein [Trichoderma ceciliae]
MACGSGCCRQSAEAPIEQDKRFDQPLKQEVFSCPGDIPDNGPDKLDFVATACDEPTKKDDKSCLDTCCGGPVEGQQDAEVNDDGDDGKGCCSKAETPRPDNERAPGKADPCCDQTCLDRLALRECENPQPAVAASHGSNTCKPASKCGRGKSGKPCDGHSRKIREMYMEKLEALGCICRALVALGQESCCNARRRSFGGGVRRRSSERPSSRSRCSADSCCAEKRLSRFTKGSTGIFADAAPGTDLEKRLSSGSEKEHVILSISGMTCTGCETKLTRSLDALSSVKNLKTSLVLARAEFDLVGSVSVSEITKHLERTTEFRCERILDQGSSLDIVVCDRDASSFVNQPWPDGVTGVRVVDEKTVNVSFNAEIIGARDLVERGWADHLIRLASPRLDPALEAGSRHVRHMGYMTLLSACLTVPVLVMAWAPLPKHHIEYGSASLALATLVQCVVAGPFYPMALKALVFSRVIEMDLLIVLSTSAAYIYSVVSFAYLASGHPLSTGQFFETSTLLVTLIMVGRWVAALARQKAVLSISVRSLQNPTALIVADNGEREIDARLLQYGDVFKVVPDSRMPTDGTVISGSSEVDESMMTGESMPVEKRAKSQVIAGSVNGSGTLCIRLTRLPGDNTISTIAGMVDEAKLSKPRIQGVADRVASYFVPVVVALTVVVFSIWVAIGIKVRGLSGSEATIQAITYAMTVLIVSCPCAIGLAVPMVVVIAGGVAAERGAVFKSAESLEVAYRTSHVVFDKTGTITEGKLTVAREWYADGDRSATESMLLGLVESIKHPVSAAIALHLNAQGVSSASVSDPKALTGKGVEGIATGSGLALQAGNSRWLCLTPNPIVQSMLSQGYTVFGFTIGGSVAALFGLQDSIRPDSASTVQTLLDRGISVHIISGDDEGAVRSVAARLNIAETNVRSRCTPADKQAYIRSLLEGPASPSQPSKSETSKEPVVIFCGDGTNDAAALAQATIGVHMSEGGTDVAKSAADVVLMRPSLAGVLTVIAVSRKSMRRIAFNFGWSFVYNLFAILLAAGAFVNARIPPEYAGLGELVSVLPVIAAATLLRWSDI